MSYVSIIHTPLPPLSAKKSKSQTPSPHDVLTYYLNSPQPRHTTYDAGKRKLEAFEIILLSLIEIAHSEITITFAFRNVLFCREGVIGIFWFGIV